MLGANVFFSLFFFCWFSMIMRLEPVDVASLIKYEVEEKLTSAALLRESVTYWSNIETIL